MSVLAPACCTKKKGDEKKDLASKACKVHFGLPPATSTKLKSNKLWPPPRAGPRAEARGGCPSPRATRTFGGEGLAQEILPRKEREREKEDAQLQTAVVERSQPLSQMRCPQWARGQPELPLMHLRGGFPRLVAFGEK